jgi:hypothetical protein
LNHNPPDLHLSNSEDYRLTDLSPAFDPSFILNEAVNINGHSDFKYQLCKHIEYESTLIQGSTLTVPQIKFWNLQQWGPKPALEIISRGNIILWEPTE